MPQNIAAIICREMKWDYEQYQSQPSWFKTTILNMLQAEAEANAKKKK